MNGIFEETENRKIWTGAIFAYVIIWGIATQLRGSFLSNIQDTFTVSRGLLGLVATAGTVSFAFSALFFGMFAGKVQLERLIIIGIGLTAISTIILGISPTYLLFLGFLALSGIFMGIPGGLARPLIGHLYSDSRGKIFSLNEAFWAIGATLGPIISILVMEFLGLWRYAYILLGIFTGAVSLIMLTLDSPEVTIREDPISFEKVGDILKNPVTLAVLFGIFFNVGVEGGIFTWLVYYLEEVGFSHVVARISLSGFLAAYIPGRFINSKIVEKFDQEKLVLLNSAVVSLLIFSAFFLLSGYWMIFAILLSGFFISTIWPNLFTLGVEEFPNYSGPINGLAMMFDPLGISTIPPIMGFLAGEFYMDLGMQFLVVPMLVVVMITLFLNLK